MIGPSIKAPIIGERFLKYAIDGQTVLLETHTKELIETGVAALAISQSKPGVLEYAAQIDEPLMIQAGTNLLLWIAAGAGLISARNTRGRPGRTL